MIKATSLEKSASITIGGKTVTIKKLNMRKTIAVLQTFDNLPPEIMEMAGKDATTLLNKLPIAIAKLLPQFSRVIVLIVDDEDVTEDFLLDKCSLEEILLLVQTIIETSNVAEILERLKKIKAAVVEQKEITATGSKK
jgi:hypothetical protein